MHIAKETFNGVEELLKSIFGRKELFEPMKENPPPDGYKQKEQKNSCVALAGWTHSLSRGGDNLPLYSRDYRFPWGAKDDFEKRKREPAFMEGRKGS